MDYFKMVKDFYDRGFEGYTDEGIKIFVKANMITAEQYKEITGIDYTV